MPYRYCDECKKKSTKTQKELDESDKKKEILICFHEYEKMKKKFEDRRKNALIKKDLKK